MFTFCCAACKVGSVGSISNESVPTSFLILLLGRLASLDYRSAHVMGEDYPLEIFRVLKNKEMREYGTKSFFLEAWDRLGAGELR